MGNGNEWLYLYCKYQFIYYSLIPLYISYLFLIKHEKETKLLDKLLDWLHWKSEFTLLGMYAQLGRVGRYK